MLRDQTQTQPASTHLQNDNRPITNPRSTELNVEQDIIESEYQQSHTDVCEQYEIGICPVGISGNTLINGHKCKMQHPIRCKNY